jgi:hypothetical protein
LTESHKLTIWAFRHVEEKPKDPVIEVADVHDELESRTADELNEFAEEWDKEERDEPTHISDKVINADIPLVDGGQAPKFCLRTLYQQIESLRQQVGAQLRISEMVYDELSDTPQAATPPSIAWKADPVKPVRDMGTNTTLFGEYHAPVESVGTNTSLLLSSLAVPTEQIEISTKTSTVFLDVRWDKICKVFMDVLLLRCLL